MKITKKDLIFICCIVGLFFIFFGSVIFTDLTFFYRDISQYYYPTRYFAAESIQNGQIPFWNPYLFCGEPFLSTLQHALFYPLSFMYYLLPFNLGFKYFFIVHIFLAGCFIYLLMRKLNLSSYCSFIAAIIFIFSGYLISTINLLTTLSSVVWAPLILLFFYEAIQREKYFFALLSGITLSFQFFTGQPEIVYMTILMVGFYLFFNIVHFILFKTKEESIKKKRKEIFKKIRQTSAVFILGLVVLFLISIFQIFPFFELIKNSSRIGGVVFDKVTRWSFHPLELVTLVIPSFSRNFMGSENWFSQNWLRTVFIGIFPVILCTLSLKFKQNYKNHIFFFGLWFFSLILSFGKWTPLYDFLYKYFPGFNFIRYPVKFMFLVSFSLVVLAGIGLEHLINAFNSSSKKANETFAYSQSCRESNPIAYNSNYFPSLMKMLLYLFTFLSITIFVIYFNKKLILEWCRGHYSGFNYEYFSFVLKDYVLMLIFFAAGIIIIFLGYKNKITVNNIKFFITIVIFTNLAIVNFNSEPMMSAQFYKMNSYLFPFAIKNYERISLTPKTYLEVISSKPRYGTDYVLNLRDTIAMLPNSGLKHHLFNAKGYGSLELNRYKNFMRKVNSQTTPASGDLVNLLGIKYLISLWKIDSKYFELIKDNGVKIYENKWFLPRVFVVPQAVVITEEAEISAKLGNRNFDPSKEVIIEPQASSFRNQVRLPVTTNPSSPLPLSSGERIKVRGIFEIPIYQSSGDRIQNLAKGIGKAKITNYESNEVDIEAELTYPGWLVLTDTYYPGWKVYIDGKQGNIYKADYLFRAVYLDSGRHKVRFIYEPTLFKVGLSITLLTILALGITGGYYLGFRV